MHILIIRLTGKRVLAMLRVLKSGYEVPEPVALGGFAAESHETPGRAGLGSAGEVMSSRFFPKVQGAIRMKTSLVALLLALSAVASSQDAAPAQPQAAQTSPSQPQQKKEIKDPAEYNAYVGAAQQTDATAKISGLEAFLVQYPNSVMKEDALELLMGTYQQAGNQAKVIDTATRLLVVNPDNARALVLLAYNERAAQKWPDAKQHAERGLQAVTKMNKPEGVSDADFTKQKGQLSGLLNSVAGFSALQVKDYASAQ